MADPLSIAGSIAGIISLGARIGVTLNEFITSAKFAPASIRMISDELTTLTYVLARVQKVINEGGGGAVDGGLLSDVLSGCMKSFQDLEAQVGVIRGRFQRSAARKAWAQLSWLAKEKEVGLLAGRLGEYKITLGITLQLMNLEAARSVVGIGELEETIERFVKNIGERKEDGQTLAIRRLVSAAGVSLHTISRAPSPAPHVLDMEPRSASADSGIGIDDGGPQVTPSSANIGGSHLNKGKQKENMSTPQAPVTAPRPHQETRTSPESSKAESKSIGDTSVLLSAATAEEVQGYSSFNSWLSGFASSPTPVEDNGKHFSANLAKLKAEKDGKKANVVADTTDNEYWSHQEVLESIKPMIRKDVSEGEVHVIVKDLILASARDGGVEKHVEEKLMSPESKISDLVEILISKGYKDICGFKIHGEEDSIIPLTTPKSRVTPVIVSTGPSCYDLRNGYQINLDETLIEFFNRRHGPKANESFDMTNHGTYLSVGNTLRRVTIQFKKTLRLPEDGNTYHLPKDIGSFNLFKTSAFENMPDSLQAKGGLFFPIYQREALCLAFSHVELGSGGKRKCSQFAIKIYAGGVNAVTGAVAGEDKESEQEYIVVPLQKWLGGFCTAPGEAKQFVSMPLGSGYTVEKQLTGKENIGGIQLEIVPRYLDDCLFGKVRVGDRSVKVDTDTLESASFDHFLSPRELGFCSGDRIYMQDLGETPYDYNFEFPRKDSEPPPENVLANPTYDKKQERPTFIRELFSGDRTWCYDPRSSLLVSPIMPIPLNVIPQAEWEVQPFEIPCSPFAQVRDVSRAIQQSIPGGWVIMELEFSGKKICSFLTTTLHEMGISSPQKVYPRGLDTRSIRGGNSGGLWNEDSGGWDMGLAAGGRIKQTIVKDPDPRVWNRGGMKIVNIQMVNSVAFEAITGLVPPMPSISFEEYAKAKIPYYIHDQANPSSIRGQFNAVSTVLEMDGQKGVEFLESLKPSESTLVGCVCCERNICDCILDVCKHTFCHSCVEYYMVTDNKATCGLCNTPATRIIRFSSSMLLRPSSQPTSHQIIGKPTSDMSLETSSSPTPPSKHITPDQQKKLQVLLAQAIQADNAEAVMVLLRAGAKGADNSIIENSIFYCYGTQREDNVVFDLLLAQVQADARQRDIVDWAELMSIAIGRRNEYCAKRLSPLCIERFSGDKGMEKAPRIPAAGGSGGSLG